MKIKVFCFLLMFMPMMVIAQEAHYGISAAFVGSCPSGYRPHWGFQVGPTADFPLLSFSHDYLRIHPSLLLTSKGWKDDIYDMNGLMIGNKHDWHFSLYYLELPLLAEYVVRLKEKESLVFGAGPYLAYGLWGRNSIDLGIDYVKDPFASGDFRRFDAGIVASIGIELKKLQVSVEYSRGFIKPAKGTLLIGDSHNQTFALKLAYRLGHFSWRKGSSGSAQSN